MLQLKKIVRLQEWWVHILPPILLFYYLGMDSETNINKQTFIKLSLLILTAIITAFAGYFLNDLFDIKEDKIAGKKNFISKIPVWLRYSFLPILFILFFTFIFLNRSNISENDLYSFFLVFLLNIILFILYSVPPIRLKSNLWMSLILDALYSGTFFYVLAFILSLNLSYTNLFQLKDSGNNKMIGLILIWGFIRGLRNYLTHLCDDKKNDEAAGVITLATRYGENKIQLIANIHFLLEIIFLLAICYSCSKMTVAVLFIFIVFAFIWLIQFIRFTDKKNPWLNDLYEMWLPLIILTELILSDYSFYPLLIFHVILFPNYLVKIYNLVDRIYFYTIFKIIGPIRKR